MTATIPWACLDCQAAGTTTGTDAGADKKHVTATGHATTTSTSEAAVMRMGAT